MDEQLVRWEFQSVFLANGYILNGCWVLVGMMLLYAMGLPVYLCTIAALPHILKYRAQPNFIEIDRNASEIRFIYRRLWRNDVRSYPITHWRRVRSYITPRKYPQNIVELLPIDGDSEGLPIASFDPARDESKFLYPTEASEAHDLRQKLAQTGLFVDAGFSPAGTSRRTKNILRF
jgi:hypothetical protein